MTTQQSVVPWRECATPWFLGVDVGGTSIKIGLVDDRGQTIGYTSIPTDEPKGPRDAMGRTVQATRCLLDELGLTLQQISRVGLGTPGSQDIANGRLIEPPNHPHWWNFPIVRCLEEEIGLPVSFVNDANAAAFGEFWVGTGRQHASMVLLTLGTGVGGGIIIDGNLVVGANSFGGECGHIIVDSRPDARLCVWGGGRGQLEAYASASAVAVRAQEAVSSGVQSALGCRSRPITAKRVYEAALDGDPLALEIIDETADYLGIGIANLVHIVDPGLVVLGGAMNFGGSASAIGQRFLLRTQKAFQSRSFDYVFSGTTLEFAVLGGDAGYLGAAGIARDDYHRAPRG
jgi:glucokinase